MISSRMIRLTLIAGAGFLLLAGCGGADSDFKTITDSQSLSRFDVPQDWNTYELNELSTLPNLPFDSPFQGLTFPAVTSIGFDGAPVRDVTSLASSVADADYPIGAASVKTLGTIQRDFLSREMLSQSVLPFRGLPEMDILFKEDFSFGSGFDGVRVLVSFGNDAGNDRGVAYLISVSDPDDTRIYSIVAGCSRGCYLSNEEAITKVVDSWLVNKKG